MLQAACEASSSSDSAPTTCGDGNLPVFRMVLSTSFVLPAIAKGLHVARLPFALENLSARCQADRPYQASCHKHRLPFAGKRHFLFALTNDYVFNFNRHLQPLIITVVLYSIFLFSWEINISNKDTRKRFRLYCARN